MIYSITYTMLYVIIYAITSYIYNVYLSILGFVMLLGLMILCIFNLYHSNNRYQVAVSIHFLQSMLVISMTVFMVWEVFIVLII